MTRVKTEQQLFKGISNQAKASLLLFLSSLRNPAFETAVLQDKRWERFDLNFASGKRVVCEFGHHNETIATANLKTIIEKIASRDSYISSSDDIIIACKSVTQQLIASIEQLRSDPLNASEKFLRYGFDKYEIRLIAKTHFFELSARDVARELYATLYDLVGIWQPKKDLERGIARALIRNVFLGSKEGMILERKDMLDRVEEEIQQLTINRAIKPNASKAGLSRQLSKLKDIASGKKPIEGIEKIDKPALVSQPERAFYFLEQIRDCRFDIAAWRDIWLVFLKGQYSSTLLQIFNNNIDARHKAEFILEFFALDEVLDILTRDQFILCEALDMAHKIIFRYPGVSGNVLGLITKILDRKSSEYKEIASLDSDKALISGLIKDIYFTYRRQGNEAKIREVISVVDSYFNLVVDDSPVVTYTPDELFLILYDYIGLSFHENFLEVAQLVSRQLEERYKALSAGRFKGWEFEVNGAHLKEVSVADSDKHFVTMALQPALERYYNAHPEDTWKFINENCVSRDEESISEKRPDFLNRAALSVVVSEYEAGAHDEEALAILKDFITMRKGVPHKAGLIFRSLAQADLTDEKRWGLVKAGIEFSGGLPRFIQEEQITIDLAAKGREEALRTLVRWSRNNEFASRQRLGEAGIVNAISRLLDQEATFKMAVLVLAEYLSTVAFKDYLSSHRAEDLAKAIAKIIASEPETGLSILDTVYKTKNLTTNQQIIICSSLNHLPDDNDRLLLNAYKTFLQPVLNDLGSCKEIEKKFTSSLARESIVGFAGKLAKNKNFNEALALIRTFAEDSDPLIINRKDDPQGRFNYHERIKIGQDVNEVGTVRGRVCMALRELIVLDARGYIPDVVSLVEKLCRDPNYYVRKHACVPLLELVKMRDFSLPGIRLGRFLDKETSEKVEDLAIEMLDSAMESVKSGDKPIALLKPLAHILGHIKNLNEEKAWEVVSTFRYCGFEDVVSEFARAFIFFAELRVGPFHGMRRRHAGRFNPARFKEVLEDLILNGSPNVKRQLSWEFWALVKESAPASGNAKNKLNYEGVFNASLKYMTMLSQIYDPIIYKSIYRFVRDNMDSKLEECYELWYACLKKERKYINDNIDARNLSQMRKLPFYNNGALLEKLFEKNDRDKFLRSLEYLIQYPSEVSLGDIDRAIRLLQEFPIDDKKAKRVFGRVVSRNPRYEDLRQEWLAR